MCGHRRYEYVSWTHDEGVRSDAGLRASDAERERVVERLRVHAGEGRLDVDELEERIEAVYAAKTRGELADLLRDLPEQQPGRVGRAARSGSSLAWLAMGWMPLIVAIALFAFAPPGIAWMGWVILGWWLFAGHHGRRGRRRRTVVA
jgi:Domain of unknown function (DUF1707)